MRALLCLCCVLFAQGVQGQTTTYYTETAQPSCRYNCGNHLGSCSCSSSCQYNGNCCDDFYSYCDYGTTEYPTPTQPSCRYNCGSDMGSCSCSSSCQWNGNCCDDYNYQCGWITETTAPPSCRYNCGYDMGSCSCSSSCQWNGNCCYDYHSMCGWSTDVPQETTAPPSCRYNCGYDMGSCSCSSSCQWNGNCCHDYHSMCGWSTDVPQETTAPPSCRYNCGYDMGSCSCSSSCQWNGNCCHDYHSMCGWSTDVPQETTAQPSCRYNCGSDMGSCSCSSSCQWNGNCCHDFNYECGHLQTSAPTPGNCGGYLYGSSGTFESPNYPNNYQNYLDCTWYIRPGRQFIRLQISDLDTECCCDWVYVYDGSSTSSRNVLQLCSTNYVVYHSTGPYLTVRFRTDHSVTNRGFQASYTSVAESSCQYNCGYQAGNCSCSSDCEYRGTCCDDFRAYCNSTSGTTSDPGLDHSTTTDQPSCRYNCGYDMGSCSCSYSCQWNGNCCHDYNSYCESTTEEPPTGQTTAPPSCRYNCGNHLGSCSCSSSCQYNGNCCDDFYSYCDYGTTEYPTTSQPSCRYNCGYHLGSCSCSSSCQYNGNCCDDFYSYCDHTTNTPTPRNCGGYLYGSSGTFESPNYPNNYQNYLDCTWYIRPGHQFIRLQISDLDTECCCDPVDVYDGHSTSSRRVLQLCSTNYVVYHSTGPYVTVRFRTDSSVTKQGFQASYTSVAESSCQYNCGYEVGNCSCDSGCEYRGTCCADYTAYCKTTSDQPVTTFPELTPTSAQPSCRYNCGYDMGSCSCSSSCQSNGSCCYDYHYQCGFYFTTSNTPVTCGGFLYGSHGTFESPNYPNNYPDNLDCTWYIRPGHQFIRLEISNLSTECGYDWVDVYDGYNTNNRRVLQLCHTNQTVYHSTGHYVTVHFRTDGSVSRGGFYASYRIVAESSCQYNCGYQAGNCSCDSGCKYRGTCCADYTAYCNSTSQQPGTTTYPGLTTSPAYSSCRYNCGYYATNCSCHYSCPYYGNCCHDYNSYCSIGTTPSGSCGGSLFGSGTFTSPNHPGYYSDNSYCVWQLRAAYDQRVFLHFSYLELENCCSCDYIALYDGPSVYSPYLGRVCNNSVSSFHSTSNYMTVLFRTDGSIVGRGFRAEFTSSLKSSSGSVDCSSGNMNIVINRAYLNSLGYDSNNLYLNDPYCRPQISSDNLVFNFPLNTCGNIKQFVNGRIVYSNFLRAWPSTHGEITRQSYLKMNVSCLMESDSVSQIYFVVEHGGNSSIIGSGRFNTTMAFYTSSSFYYQVTEFPYLVDLNQYLYVQVYLTRPDSSLVLFLDTCVASPSPFNFEYRPYYLVRDGCTSDETYQPITSGSQYRARFSFRAFQFLRGTDSVYLQCKVVICPASDFNSRCRRGCSRRVARELESEHESQTLVVGPIQLKDPEKEKEGPEKQNEA
ncbi:deleted in malignant brain tumors 1 protein-like isoform X3 [Cyprinodon tularosa]|uniref:deleted in malignant brain tumors 1 protein-like isoform X3 n=1 Tax=Cyprinodon tularosa TaxID=77115 RepID=UPI0018E254EF|nr:deleted in malignant brain tumors 1 protein-like isoform X3 [Cyprinodon tularosa]